MLMNKICAKGKILSIFDFISISSVMQLMAPHNCIPYSVGEQQILIVLIVYRKQINVNQFSTANIQYIQ